ncbi:MAG: hypothetical protein ACLP5H_01005 [Desulfomonilaceae bacterium]
MALKVDQRFIAGNRADNKDMFVPVTAIDSFASLHLMFDRPIGLNIAV